MVGKWISFWGPAYFQVRTASFREGILPTQNNALLFCREILQNYQQHFSINFDPRKQLGTLPKTSSSHLKIGRVPKGNSSSNHHFSELLLLVSGRVIFITPVEGFTKLQPTDQPPCKASLPCWASKAAHRLPRHQHLQGPHQILPSEPRNREVLRKREGKYVQ